MLNSLPPELIRQIMQSSVPSTNHYETYPERQATLQFLCLVCNLFREIAQPLLFEVIWMDGQSNLIALHRTLKSEGCRGTIRRFIFEDEWDQDRNADLESILRSCQDLRTLTLHLNHGKSLSLSVLQDLPHLADLSLFGEDYQFLSDFRLDSLTSLSIGHTTVEFAPTLLNPEVLPSLRSLAMFNIYDAHEIAYLRRSRLANLIPQLDVLFLNARIIQRGLDYLIPALSRTLFEFDSTSSDDRIDPLQVAQHLRMDKKLNSKNVVQKFIVSLKDQRRQISLRSIYLDISLEDLSSLPVHSVETVQDLLRVCKEKGIEVIYEAQEDGFAGEVRPSEEFSRRQREIRKLEATSE